MTPISGTTGDAQSVRTVRSKGPNSAQNAASSASPRACRRNTRTPRCDHNSRKAATVSGSGASHRRKPTISTARVGCSARVSRSMDVSNPISVDDDPLPLAPGKSAKSSPMKHDFYSDAYLRDILVSVRTIAVIGASPRPHRPSHGVMRYLQRQGDRTIPVNPFAVGDTILGETCYAGLAEIGEPIDMVDVFRRSEAAGEAVDAAIAIGAKAVWLQLGVIDAAAASRAEAHGLKVVMDRCPAIEIPRLGLIRS